MIQLTPQNYSKVAPLVDNVPFNTLFARVVIENKVDGQVFVDDLLNPTASLIIHKYGMALLCGNDENDFFNNKLVSYLKHGSLNKSPAKWMLTSPHQWEDKLASFFLQTQRINYKYNTQFQIHPNTIPDLFTLKKIDEELYHKIQGSVVPEHFWKSAEDFLENGIGYSLLYGDQIVSTTFASYIVGDQIELGVETSEKFRRKGYAIYAASALVSYCLENGYKPLWACRQENIGSSRLAERLGFIPASYHPYYCLPSG